MKSSLIGRHMADVATGSTKFIYLDAKDNYMGKTIKLLLILDYEFII